MSGAPPNPGPGGHVEPKLSAAAIILSKPSGGGEPEILLIRRSPKLRFMGGHHAFPGGRIDPGESAHRVRGADDPVEAQAIHAVAREVFEETGLLLGVDRPPPAGEASAARRDLIAERVGFDEILDRFGVLIDAGKFLPAGVWITPKGSPIRFHSRYYAHFHEGPRSEELIEGEIDAIDWMTADEARRRWRSGGLILPAPVAYALQQIAAVPFPQVLEPLRRTTHIVPDTPGRIEYACGIHVLPLVTPTLPPATGTNCVVVGEREFIVIDPATPLPREQENLVRQIETLLEHGGRLKAIALTHSHVDHIGAVEMMKARYGIPVWAHALTAGRVPFAVDRALEHDEVLTLGGDPDFRLRCLHTPGHDAGHLCFYEETTRALIAGDMVAERGTIVVAAEYGGDMTDYLNSLESLLVLDISLMIPSHGLAILDAKKKIQEYIDHRLAREARIREAVESGARDMAALLARAYDDVAPAALPLAEKSARAHLARLGVEL